MKTLLRPAYLSCLLLASAASTAAQTLPLPAPSAAGLLTRSDFSLVLALLATQDPRFTAAGSLTADIDLVDYGAGRVNLLVDYEGVLGSERHDFDLNHGNYVLQTSLSRRFGSLEVAGVFHHVSRHLSDRQQQGSISWNVLGVEATRQWTVGQSTVAARLGVGKVHEAHFVDYTWTNEIRIVARRQISPRTALFADGDGTLLRVERGKVRDYGPCGARVEAGVRLTGDTRAAVELFMAYERRVDAFPTDRTRVRLFAFGFRLVS